MKTEKPYWFGLPIPKSADLAWGARAVCRNNKHNPGRLIHQPRQAVRHWLEFYPDRQQMSEPNHYRKVELKEWINGLSLSSPSVRAWEPSHEFAVDEGDLHIRGEPRDGYVYFVAWIDKEKNEPKQTRTVSKRAATAAGRSNKKR